MARMSEVSRAYLAVGIAMVSVSFASIFIKWSESPPFIIAAYRLGLSCLLLLPLMLWVNGFSDMMRFTRKELMLVVLSGVALTFHFELWIVSLSLTLVATSVILVTSHPLFVAAVSHFLLKEEVKRVAVVGIVIAFGGVVVLYAGDYSSGGESLLGDMLAFVGGLFAGVYFLSGRVARQTIGVVPYAFSVYALSTVLLFFSAALAGDKLAVSDPRELGLFFLMALIPTILGHTMFNYALKKVPAHIISTSVLGEPIGASLLAYMLLPDEVPTVWVVAGGALVILGLYLVLALGYGPAVRQEEVID
ncbi:MAG: DMT family transporter [Thermoplasmata archaeon]|jgi:drug/metabolite transporter (DMT)-like permease|nr:DMT family transporter [Thermoplasmata archaeon]